MAFNWSTTLKEIALCALSPLTKYLNIFIIIIKAEKKCAEKKKAFYYNKWLIIGQFHNLFCDSLKNLLFWSFFSNWYWSLVLQATICGSHYQFQCTWIFTTTISPTEMTLKQESQVHYLWLPKVRSIECGISILKFSYCYYVFNNNQALKSHIFMLSSFAYLLSLMSS